jgi:hypothetical protein
MVAARKIIYLDPIERDQEEPALRFRLVYQGPLRASQTYKAGQQPDRLSDHKHEIRKIFHRQLKTLWGGNKFLRDAVIGPSQWKKINQPVFDLNWDLGSATEKDERLVDIIARKYPMLGHNFVPLVYEDASLLCSLDILFLRRDTPGNVLNAGDLDNRLKTLIDALKMPRNMNELGKYTSPAKDEDPFFCLLDDDKGITSFAVESDNLLQYDKINNQDDQSQVNIVITVEIKPYSITLFNLAFA